MYCTKCGKFIGTDANICDECKQKELSMNETAPLQAENNQAQTNGYYQQPYAAPTQPQQQPNYYQQPQNNGYYQQPQQPNYYQQPQNNGYCQQPQQTNYYQQSETQDTSAINLGGAIAAIILSTVGFFFVYMGLLMMMDPEAAVGLMVVGLLPAILGLIFGIRSISNFKETSYIKSGKRIPVLIMGILSTIDSGLTLFLAFLVMMLAGTLM